MWAVARFRFQIETLGNNKWEVDVGTVSKKPPLSLLDLIGQSKMELIKIFIIYKMANLKLF